MAKLMTLSEAKHDKSEKSDFHLKIRMSNKNPDLLPLLKGAWLVPLPFPSSHKNHDLGLCVSEQTVWCIDI